MPNTVTRRRGDRYRFANYRLRFIEDLQDFPAAPSILCEGDSWFGYPFKGPRRVLGSSFDKVENRPLRTVATKGPRSSGFTSLRQPGGPALDHIAELGSFNLLRMEEVGDKLIRDMMAPIQRARLERSLGEFNFELVLYSGGGNDILGDNLRHLLLKKVERTGDPKDPRSYLAPAFKAKVVEMADTYREIYDLVQASQGGSCPLLVHGYDQIYPSNNGFELFGIRITGPWVKPTMDKDEFAVPKSQPLRIAIVREMLDAFNTMLAGLAAELDHFHYVRLLDTLTDAKSYWDNEIHPKSRGFKKLARHYDAPMCQFVPTGFA